MQSQCPSRDKLSGFVLGTLAEDSADVISDHVEECPACEETIQNLEQTVDSVVEKLRQPEAEDPFTLESGCRRVVALVEAIGRDPLFSMIGADPVAANESEELGTIRSYRLLAKLGQGGMGSVYKALHVDLDKVVALKVLPQDRLSDEAAVARFRREMKAVGKLNHPNIVQATDAGEENGMHYLVMELVDGIDLSKLVRQHGPLPVADACELIRQAGEGLQHADEHGLVHRDIKPSNLMIAKGQGGRVKSQGARAEGQSVDATSPLSLSPQPWTLKILDLGLALLAGPQATDTSELTATGQVMGTIDYMAPEQGSDTHSVDIRADVYSLGATLYKLLTGLAPFEGQRYNSPIKKLTALANTEPVRIDAIRGEVPSELADLVQRMLSKSPEDRPSTPIEVARLLEPFARSADLGGLMQSATQAEPAVPVRESQTTDPTFIAETNVAEPEGASASDSPGGTPRSETEGRGDADHALPDVRACHPPEKRSVRRVLGGVAAVVLLGVIVFKFATRDGTLYVELDSEQPVQRIEVDGNEVQWSLPGSENRFQFDVDPGERTVRMFLKDGTEIITEATETPIEIAAGGDYTIRGWLEVDEPRPEGSGPGVAKFALQFDGVDDCVEILSLRYDGTHPITIEAWAQPLGASRAGTVVYNSSLGLSFYPHAPERSFWQVHAPRLIESTNAPSFGPNQVVSSHGPWLNQPVELAVVYDETSVRLFVDGHLEGEIEGKGMPLDAANNHFKLGGAFAMPPHGFFRGRIDEARISSIARYTEDFTPQERFEPDEHTLALYHFDEGAGDVLVDSSGNGHHGEIHGASWVRVPDYEVERSVAEWVLANGGQVDVNVDGETVIITAPEPLPVERFVVRYVGARHGTAVTDGQLAELELLNDLQHLKLPDCNLTDSTLQHLARIVTLRELVVSHNAGVGDDGLTLLSGLPELHTLAVGGTSVTELGLAQIGDFPALRNVGIGSAQLTHASIEHLSGLNRVGIYDARDEDLPRLRQLSGVAFLGVRGNEGLNRGTIEALHEAMPDCTIESSYGTFGPTTAESRNFALQFDGVDDYVELPVIEYDPSGPLTLEAWVTPDEFGQYNEIVASPDKIQLALHGGTARIGMTVEDGSTTIAAVSGVNSEPVPMTTLHLCGVFEETEMRLYANGHHVGSTPFESPRTTERLNFYLGCWDTVISFYSGMIQEVRISSIARYTDDFTPAERFEADEHTLALYHFGEGDGEVLVDASGNERHGTIHGATWVDLTEHERRRQEVYERDRGLAAQLLENNVSLGLVVEGEVEEQLLAPGDPLPEAPFIITMADIRRVPFLDEVLPILAQATEVADLRAVATGITAEQLQILAPLQDVRNLDLSASRPITNELIQVAAEQFPDLDQLWLVDTVLLENGLPGLAEMGSLRVLHLSGAANADAGVEAARELPNLAELHVRASTVTWPVLRSYIDQNQNVSVYFDADRFVSHHGGSFAVMVNGELTWFDSESADGSPEWYHVQGIDLSGTAVGTDDFAFTGSFEGVIPHILVPGRLKELSLSGTEVSDGVLKYFRPLGLLERIDLSNTALTDHGVLQLSAFPAIRSVDLRGTQATASAIAWLSTAKPECEILSDFSEQDLSDAPLLFTFDPAMPAASPFNELQRDDIDSYELTIAGDGDPANAPSELVGIYGDSQLRHWTLFRAKGRLIDFSADSQTLVSAGVDGRIVFWDVTTGRARRILRRDQDLVSVTVLPQSQQIMIHPRGPGSPGIFDIEGGELVEEIPAFGTIQSVSADGNFAIGVHGSSGMIWNVPARNLLHTLEPHDTSVIDVAMQPQGRMAATVCQDGCVKTWDLQSGNLRQTFYMESGHAGAVTFSPDGQTLAVGGDAGEVAQWRVDDGAVLLGGDLTGGRVGALAFSGDGQTLAVGMLPGDVVLMDADSGEPRQRLGRDWLHWETVCFSPNGHMLAAASANGLIRIWSVNTGEELHQEREHRSKVAATSLSEDGHLLGTAFRDGTATVRDTTTGAIVQQWTIPEPMMSIAVHAGSDLVTVGTDISPNGYCVNLYSLQTGEFLAMSESLGNRVIDVQFGHDGRYLVAATAERQIFIMDAPTLAIRHRLLDRDQAGFLFEISRDGQSMVTFSPYIADAASRFRIWNIRDGQMTYQSPNLPAGIQSIDFSPDGRTLAIAISDRDAPLRLWDLETNTETHAFGSRLMTEQQDRQLGRVVFDPNGGRLFAAFGEGRIQVWDLEKLDTPDAMTAINVAGPRDSFRDLHVGPAGRHVVTHNENDTIYVLRVEQGAAAEQN